MAYNHKLTQYVILPYYYTIKSSTASLYNKNTMNNLLYFSL